MANEIPSPTNPAPQPGAAKPVAFETRDGKRVEFKRTVLPRGDVDMTPSNVRPNGAASAVPASPVPASAASPAAPAKPTDAAAVPAKPEDKPAEPAKPEVKPGEDPKFAQRLAMLARREAALVQKQRSYDADRTRREATLKNMQEQIDNQRKELEAFQKARDAAKADPLKWLEFGGHSYDAAAKQVLNDKQPDPLAVISAERERLTAEMQKQKDDLQKQIEAEKTAREEAQKQEQERLKAEQRATVQRFEQSIVAHVVESKDKYPLINHFGQPTVAMVPQLIHEYFQKTLAEDMPKAQAEGRAPVGRILLASEAATLVEQHLRSQYDAAQKLVQPQPNPSPAPAVPTPAVNQPTDVSGQRPTITNAQVTTPSPSPAPQGYLSEKERWQRALAAMDAANARAKPQPA